MSTHSRRTTIRAIEAPPSTTSSYRSKARHSENQRGTTGTQLVSYQRPQSHTTKPSRYSRPPSTAALQRTTPADFPLPRSARRVPPPSIKSGSRISVTVTNPEEATAPRRGSYRGVTSPGYTKRTTETYVFSPRNNSSREYSLPSSSPNRTSQFSARSHRSRRTVRMPFFSGDSAYRSTYARRPERLALPPPERTRLTSRAMSTPRSAASTSTFQPVSRRALEEASLNLDDTETLAPSDSISQASGKARRRRQM